MCVKNLTTLPLSFTYNALLAELLFSQLLALPTTRLPQLAYCTVMVDLCKVRGRGRGGGNFSCSLRWSFTDRPNLIYVFLQCYCYCLLLTG